MTFTPLQAWIINISIIEEADIVPSLTLSACVGVMFFILFIFSIPSRSGKNYLNHYWQYIKIVDGCSFTETHNVIRQNETLTTEQRLHSQGNTLHTAQPKAT